MKTRKTKKRNIIRRAVAFLLCMTMVLGLGMQDVIEQVYAEEAIPVIEQEAATEEAGELTTEGAAPEENAETAEEPDESVEEAEEQSANSTPSQPADAEENTKTDVPSAPAENAGSEEGEKQNPSAPAEDGQSGSDSETSAETNPGGNTGNEITAPAEDGNTVTNPDETTGEDTEDDAAVSDEEEETAEPEEKVTELTYAAGDGSFSVTAAALGEDTDLSSYELHAAQVQKDGEEADRYAAAEELVAGALDAESRRIEELQAYDIWFTYTESGETADLSGQVQISLEYTAPEFPEGTDAQLEVFCLNDGAAEAVDGTDALAAGCELYALAWAVPAGYEETWEDDQVIIRVTAEDGVVPEDTKLSVTPIVKKEEEELANLSEEERAEAEAINEQYEQTEQKLNEELQTAEAVTENEVMAVDAASGSSDAEGVAVKEIGGFLSYDICFVTEDGQEKEPDGKVNVSFEFKEAVIPEDVSEDAEVAVKHLKEETKSDGQKEIVIEDLTEVETTTVETTAENNAAVTKVELVADSFSEYTIIWYRYHWTNAVSNIKIHYVGTDGVELDDKVSGGEKYFEFDEDNTISLSDYAALIEGYTYQYAVIAESADGALGSEYYASQIQIETKSYGWDTEYIIQYRTEGGSWKNVPRNYNVYMIYGPTSSGGGATGELAHKKYIEKNEDGTYDLTLDVTGAVGTETNPAEVDIVFVLDMSGSMAGENLDDAQSAVNTLTTALKDEETVDSRWKLVTFSNSASIKTEWVSAESINSTIQRYKDWNCDGGTNYEAGFTQADRAIDTARQGATKIVIFLTDGQPTYHGTNSYGGGTYTNWDDYNGALDGASKISCDQFYAIGMSLPDDVSGRNDGPDYSGLEVLQNIAARVQATKKHTQNVDENGDLSGVFEDIAGEITRYAATNVTIVDQLTEYVDQVPNSDLIVKVTDENGDDVSGQEVRDGDIRASYNSETKELRLDFRDDYELNDNYTYSVTIKIEPNEEAEDLYVRNNYSYPHTGEADTGETSTGKPGIFTNVEDSAKVTWTTNNEPKEGAYNRPVVQLADEPTPPPVIEKKLSKEKYVKYNQDGTYDLTLNVSGQVGSLTEQMNVDIVLVLDLSASMAETQNGYRETNLKRAQDAVDTLTSTLENKENVNSRWKLVTFSNRLRPDVSLYDNWVNADTIYNKVASFTSTGYSKFDQWEYWTGDCVGGTNYEAALKKAGEIVREDASNNAEKIVIFLSDGQPTYHDDNSVGGSTYTNTDDYDGAIDGAKSISCNQFYAIGIGLPNNIGGSYDDYDGKKISGIQLLQDIAKNVTASQKEAINVNGGTDLSDIFADIAGSITSFLCEDVIIEDTLSVWAEEADLNAEDGLTVKVVKNAGTLEEAVVAQETGKMSDGVELTLNPTTTNNFVATLQASYDAETKKIILDFPDNYKLEGDLTYYVTVKIAPTIEAYEKYQELENNYPAGMIGDPGTDAKDNNTSVGQSGFYSNAEKGATVTYTFNGETRSDEYPKPVIQVDDMTTEDTDFITVVKTFSGLTKEQVEAIRGKDTDGDGTNDFTITVTNTDDPMKTKTLRLSDNATVSANGLTYTWKLDGYPAGKYKVEESNADVQNYKLTTTGVGGTITVEETGWTFDPNVDKVTISDGVAFTVSDNSVIMIALKNPGDYLVWTKEALSLSQQKAVEKHINGRGDEFKTATVSEIHFYSGEDTLRAGINYGGSQIVYTGDRLNFSPSRQWKHVLAGTYTMTGENDKQGDIQITNTYVLDQILVDFQKFGTDYTTKQLTAKFKLEKMITETDASGVIKIKGAEPGSEKNGEVSSEENEFGSLSAGVYCLTETEAPEGYSLLDVQIYFKVDSTGVKLLAVTDDGTITEVGNESQEMFQLVVNETSGTADAEYTIQIKNKTLYDLPQSGGPGIYLYMLGGVALMMAGTLLVYKKRKEEVLRS